MLNIGFTVENYGIKLIYDQRDTPHADMCFSKVTTTHSVKLTNNEVNLKDLFESISDYRKIVLLIFLNKNDDDLLTECRIVKSDIERLNLEFKNFLSEQIDEYYSYVKNQEDSIIEKIF